MSKILFFGPEAGVVPHFASLCLVARTLKELGHEVLFVRCKAIYPRCPVMDMYMLPYQPGTANHQQACPVCFEASHTLLGHYGLEVVELQTFMSQGLVDRAVAAMQRSGGDLLNFSYDGIEFGKMCVQDLVLSTKVSDFSRLDERTRTAWFQYVSSALMGYLMVGEALDAIPTSHVFYHNDYANNIIARLAAEKRGVRATTIGFSAHLVQDRRRYNLQTGNNWRSAQQCTRTWPSFRGLPLPAATVGQATDDILKRLGSKGGFVYSPAKTFGAEDIRSRLGLRKGPRLLAAFTSSLDELLAGKFIKEALHLPPLSALQPFQNQIEWLEALVARVESRDDEVLVVRVHPREGADKRVAVDSQHLVLLRERFDRPFRNCRFIWPADPLSSYDLGEAADVVLTSWSTIGIDLARLGVPVLHTTQGASPWPVDDFQEWAPTREGYFRTLEALLRRPASLDPLLHAYRWYHLYVMGRSVDLGDVIPAPDYPDLPPFRLPAEAAVLERCTVGNGDIQEVTLERLQESQGKESAAGEERAVMRQLRRLIRFLYTGEDASDRDYRLLLAYPGSDAAGWAARVGLSHPPEGWAIIVVDGDATVFLHGGREVRRHTPMAHRMARLASQLLYLPTGAIPERCQVITREERLLDLIRNPGRVDPSPALHSGYAGALALKDKGLVGLAREAAAGLAAGHPLCPDFLNLEGHMAALLGDTQAALERFAHVVREWPGLAKGRSNLGAMLWERGDRQGALENLAAAVRLDPANADYALNAVQALRSLGQVREAQELCEAFLRSGADEGRVSTVLGELRGGTPPG